MCAGLKAHGLPSGDMRVLGPTSNPLAAQLIIVTSAVRDLFGSYVDTGAAPLVLTSIGAGKAKITIRVVAQQGRAQYLRDLAAGQLERKSTGSALLGNSRIVISAAASRDTTDGLVDNRLLLAIVVVAAAQPIDIVNFGNVAVDASSAIPLRYADLAVTGTAVRLSADAYVAALRKILSALGPGERPMRTTVELDGHQRVLRIQYGAPTEQVQQSSSTSANG